MSGRLRPAGTVIFDPGPPPSMEIRGDGTALPEPGDTMTVQGARIQGEHTTVTYRVGKVTAAGGGRWTIQLTEPEEQQ